MKRRFRFCAVLAAAALVCALPLRALAAEDAPYTCIQLIPQTEEVDGRERRVPAYTGRDANARGEVLLEMGKPASFSLEPYTEQQVNDPAVTVRVLGPSGTLYEESDLYGDSVVPFGFENGQAELLPQFHENTQSVWVDYKEITLVAIHTGAMWSAEFDIWYDAGTDFTSDREIYTVPTPREGEDPYQAPDPVRTEERTCHMTVRDQKLRVSCRLWEDHGSRAIQFGVEEVYDPGTVRLEDDAGRVLLEGAQILDDKGNQYVYSVMGVLEMAALDAPITVDTGLTGPEKAAVTAVSASALALGGSAVSGLLPDGPDTTPWRRRRPDEAEDAPDGETPELPEEDSPDVTLTLYKPYGDLVNTKGAAVDIPLSLDGGEDLDWHFIPTVICPQGLRAVVPTVAGVGGDRTLVLGLTGAPMRVSHAELFITVVAWAMGPDGRLYKTTATTEMKLHRPGIEARRTADGALEVTCYTDSNLNGIAETRRLGPEEYRTGTDPDTGKCTVTARDPKLGSCTVEE